MCGVGKCISDTVVVVLGFFMHISVTVRLRVDHSQKIASQEWFCGQNLTSNDDLEVIYHRMGFRRWDTVPNYTPPWWAHEGGVVDQGA